ncbi:MAG: aldo/keto reductase [Clostridiales bacterium]|jgi:predicted aldo/keto reductase-like oxidoreductase|nr:aldo/keto reductase [Clostridiales bacterium]
MGTLICPLIESIEILYRVYYGEWWKMEYRELGKTGLKTSLLGFGGFHLLEIPVREAGALLNAYLDAGGNYIETAASYGNGESERKIGASAIGRRDEFVLVTKVGDREKEAAAAKIDRSLKNLRTDHVDLLLLHGMESVGALNRSLAEDGAYQAALEAKKAGKALHVGISMHGQPAPLLAALETGKFEAVMSTINYYDRCNFPEIERDLLPLAREKGAGVILMKPIADGYLYRSAERAFRYAFSRPVSVVVAGINSRQMLDMDLRFAEEYAPMAAEEERELLMDAPELGNYVCRQCGGCAGACGKGIDIMEVFASEAYYDRQMMRGAVADTAQYALSERLKFWFGQKQQGIDRYARISPNADACDACGACAPSCPYGVDIPYKMHLAGYKLCAKEIY